MSPSKTSVPSPLPPRNTPEVLEMSPTTLAVVLTVVPATSVTVLGVLVQVIVTHALVGTLPIAYPATLFRSLKMQATVIVIVQEGEEPKGKDKKNK